MRCVPARSGGRWFAVALACVAVVAGSVPARAGWPHSPAENVLASTGTENSFACAAVSDGDGGMIVVWNDTRLGFFEIYAQRIDGYGRVLWTPGGVKLMTGPTQQTAPVICSDRNGGAIVVCVDEGAGPRDLAANRIAYDGTLPWGPAAIPVCTLPSSSTEPWLISGEDPAGNAYVFWTDDRDSLAVPDIYGQRILSTGAMGWAENGIPICAAPGAQSKPRAIVTSINRLIVAWQDARSDDLDVYAQSLQLAGTTLWTDDGVPVAEAAGAQENIVIASDFNAGAFLAWQDDRGPDSELYGQELNAFGNLYFPVADGVPLVSKPGMQVEPRMVSDESGFVMAWDEGGTLVPFDVFAQRFDGGLVPQWATNGIAVCEFAGDQRGVSMVPDGAGGTLLVWTDGRNGPNSPDIYAQRLSPAGAAMWTFNGVKVGGAGGSQLARRQSAVAGVTGELLVAWDDARAFLHTDVYAQGVDRYGYLGAAPELTSVQDVPNDQGGKVRVSWNASALDLDPASYQVDDYLVWRAVSPAAAAAAIASGEARLLPLASLERGTPAAELSVEGAGRTFMETRFGAQVYYWEMIGTQIATHLDHYSLVVPTTSDSLPGSNPYTAFMVQARQLYSNYWQSLPDSGYSTDDLAPVSPAPFQGTYSGGTAALSWNPNGEPDLAFYRLYRGLDPGFVPAPGNRVAEVADPVYSDPAGQPYWYKLSAVDLHHNESGHTLLMPSGTLDARAGAHTLALSLENPLRADGTVRFIMPAAGPARLTVLDATGRIVATLANGTHAAGEHVVPMREAATPGVYFVRLDVAGQSLVRRAILLR